MVHAKAWTLVPLGDAPTHQNELVLLGSFPSYIGRDPQLYLRIAYPTVSLVHAEIFAEGGQIWVRDLGSRNGTFVNGARLEEPCPLSTGDVLQFGTIAFTLESFTETNRAETKHKTAGDLALVIMLFQRLLKERRVVPFYQPIMAANVGTPLGYEVLARSNFWGLRTPKELFEAAFVVGRVGELSHLCRVAGVYDSPANRLPHLFLNTSPLELGDLPSLLRSLDELRRLRPTQPLTLEVHELAAVETATLTSLCAALTDRNISFAFDDFGVGQSRLPELVDARPKFVKFDRRLCNEEQLLSQPGRKLLAGLVRMVSDLGIVPIAEGIETASAAKICRELGFQCMQGFYFGVPAASSAWFNADHSAPCVAPVAVWDAAGKLTAP